MAKRHNWTTNGTVVDEATSRTATEFISASNLYTQEVEDQLFALIGMGSPVSDAKPDPNYLDAQAEWDDEETEVPEDAFEYDR